MLPIIEVCVIPHTSQNSKIWPGSDSQDTNIQDAVTLLIRSFLFSVPSSSLSACPEQKREERKTHYYFFIMTTSQWAERQDVVVHACEVSIQESEP